MPNLIDRKDDQRFYALFVGRHHSGKTVASMSFPKPLLDEDFDGRIGGGMVDFLDLKGISYNSWPPRTPDLIGKLNKSLDNLDLAAQMKGQSIIQIPKTHVTDSITNMTAAFISQAKSLTHTNEKGQNQSKWVGPIKLAAPEDYQLEAAATYDYVNFIKSLPIQHVIISAHLIDQYGFDKDDKGNDLPYAPRIVTGDKLSIRDKIGENIQTGFDHVFKFERESVGGADKFYVYFRGGIACTSYSWLPFGRHEWTGKSFYDFMFSFREAKNVATQVK